MKRILTFILIVIFSIFFGSQITEAFLLVPYWKSLSNVEFYEYYSHFGLTINRFYTVLTIIAILIPVGTSVYCFFVKSNAFRYSIISTVFTFLFVLLFYLYFKDVNQQFSSTVINSTQLKSELLVWEFWHWVRLVLELITLIFLLLTFNVVIDKKY